MISCYNLQNFKTYNTRGIREPHNKIRFAHINHAFYLYFLFFVYLCKIIKLADSFVPTPTLFVLGFSLLLKFMTLF